MDYLSYHATKRLPEVTDCPFRRPSMLHCQRQQRAVVIQQQGPERLAPFLPYSGMVAAPLYAAAASWQHCANVPGKTNHDDNWKILLSGYAPDYVYDIGGLDTSRSFADLKQRSHINARAQAAGDASDFSQRIRADLPRPAPASR